MSPKNPPVESATSIEEVLCPSCEKRSVRIDDTVAQEFDSDVKKATHAARCRNANCDRSRIPPQKIKRQIDTEDFGADGSGISIGNPLSSFERLGELNGSVVAGGVLLVAFGVLMVVGIPGFGGFGEAEAAPVGEINNQNIGVTEHEAAGNWTVYGTNGTDEQYVVASEYNDTVVYLTDDGSISHSPSYYSNLSASKQSAKSWNESNNDRALSPTDITDKTAWQLYEVNGAYTLTAQHNGTTKYLHPNMTVSETPHFYNESGVANKILLRWTTLSHGENIDSWNRYSNAQDAQSWVFSASYSETSTVQLRTDLTEWDPPGNYDSYMKGNWTVMNIESEYYAIAKNDSGLVYVAENGALQTSPHGFENQTLVEDAIVESDANVVSVESETADVVSEPLNPTTTTYDPPSSSGSGGSSSLSYSSTGGSVGGGTPGEISGTVRDSNNDPVEGATVVMYSNRRTTTTDSDGKYSFSDVPTGTHDLYINATESTGVPYTENVTFNVQDDGDISVNDAPSYSEYITYDDGTLQSNSVSVSVPSANDILLTGEGANISSTVNFDQPANAGAANLTIGPKASVGERTETLNGSSDSDTISVDGNTEPTDQTLIVTGIAKSENVTYTGNATQSFTIPNAGNIEPEDATIEFKGFNTSKERTVTDSDSTGTIDNNGNKETTAKVTIKGNSSTTQRTVSGESGDSFTNNGNTNTTGDLTLTGNSVTTAKSKTASIDDDGSVTIDVGGTKTVTDVELEITGKSSRTQIYDTDDLLAGASKHSEYGSPDTDVYNITVAGGSQYDVEAEWRTSDTIYEPNGWEGGRMQAYVCVTEPDQYCDWRGGTTVAEVDNYDYDHSDHDDRGYGGRVSIYDSGVGSTRKTVDAGDRVTVGAMAYNLDSDDTSSDLSIDGATVYRVDGPGYTTVDTNSELDASFGDLGAGKTQTASLSDLEPGKHDISIDTESGIGADVKLTWNETAEAENIDVDVDGDGDGEFNRTDTLGSGETTTATVDVGAGTNSMSIDSDNANPSWSLQFDQTNATKDISADITGDGSDDITESSAVESGETVVKDVSLSSGTHNVDIAHNGPEPEWEATFTQKNKTEDPELTTNGTTVCSADGTFAGESKSCAVPNDFITDGADFDVSADGGIVNYTVEYESRTTPEDWSVDIGGTTYDENDLGVSGPLEADETVETDISDLGLGDNSVSISTSSVDGTQTELNATLDFNGSRVQTVQPEVEIVNGNNETNTVSIPDSALNDDNMLVENATIQLEQSWFTEGNNTINIITANESPVTATLEGSGISSQYRTFTPAAEAADQAEDATS